MLQTVFYCRSAANGMILSIMHFGQPLMCLFCLLVCLCCFGTLLNLNMKSQKSTQKWKYTRTHEKLWKKKRRKKNHAE